MPARSSLSIACLGKNGEALGELTIADRSGRQSLMIEADGGEVSVSELGEYVLRLQGPGTSMLEFRRPVETSPLRGEDELFGMLGRQAGLGLARLSIGVVGGDAVWRQSVRVRPEKFRDALEFEQMVADVCAWRTALALDLHSYSSAPWSLDDDAQSVQAEELLVVIRAAVEDYGFFENVARIQRTALARLERDTELALLGREEIDPFRIGRHLNSPGDRVAVPEGHPLSPGLKSLPAKVPPFRKLESLDTPENQFVKFAVGRVRALLGEAIGRCAHYADSELVRWGLDVERRLRLVANSAFFAKISSPAHIALGSPSLQRRDGYRAVLKAFLAIRAGLSLHWPEFSAAIFGETRDVPTLYEFWCLIKVRQALTREFGATLDLDQFLAEGGKLTVLRGGSSRTERPIELNGRPYGLRLHYNRVFAPAGPRSEGVITFHDRGCGTWSKIMKPDYTIALFPPEMTEEQAAEQGRLILVHLDAKYRLRSLRPLLDGEAGSRTHMPDDLDKMHAYLAGINHSLGAYALFPGDLTTLYAWGTAPSPSVGALSLIPGAAEDFGATLRGVMEAATVG